VTFLVVAHGYLCMFSSMLCVYVFMCVCEYGMSAMCVV
jgi:hypothetical protein